MKVTYYQSKQGKLRKQTSGERRINNILKYLKVNYIRECSFKKYGDPKYPRMFDFYLPDHKIAIEYDGPFHYMQESINRDKSKDAFCEIAGITLLRFQLHHLDIAYHILKDIINANDIIKRYG